METEENRVMRVEEAAVRLGVCARTVHRLMDRLGLPLVKVGYRDVGVSEEAFAKMMEHRNAKAA